MLTYLSVYAAASLASLTAVSAYLDARFLIRNDVNYASTVGNVRGLTKFLERSFQNDEPLIYHLFERNATGKNANNVFLIFEDRQWTYREFFGQIQRVGNWLMKELGVQPRELVALDGQNSPEYILLWLGLEAIGACPAFINCNLTGAPLLHCTKLCGSRFLITGTECQGVVQAHSEDLKAAGIQTIYYDETLFSTFTDLEPLPRSRQSGIKPDELASLIYTSGTTGMPKATIMPRGKELGTAKTVGDYLDLKVTDKIYTALPLYHGAAHGLCVTPSIYTGSTVVLSRKFSHKTFWPEIRASQATVLQYVGELCRYLVNAPPSPLDKQHRVRMAWGNGMRSDIWEIFRQRFGIDTIVELYAATDGLGSTFNRNRGDFTRSAIGVRGIYWHWLNRANEKRVKIDVVTEEILHDANTGFAIECEIDEPGEVLHKLDPAMEVAAFAGYFKNEAATQKRKIRDVFKKGDLWFRSGDMMRQDREGRVYFVDRLGDTFRWKSENVSTNEVSDHISKFDQIMEANVYGVQVPNTEGRAGCAAIVLATEVDEDAFRFDLLAEHAINTLPRYAVPVFIRLTQEMASTGTMKQQKGRLKSEGIDPDRIETTNDRMYWLPPGERKYVPFRREDFEALQAGKVRL